MKNTNTEAKQILIDTIIEFMETMTNEQLEKLYMQVKTIINNN